MAKNNVVPLTNKDPSFWTRFGDSLANLLSNIGVPGRDKATDTHFYYAPTSREELESAYRSDWIARKVVDIPAFDSTRMWRAWQADDNDITALEEQERKLFVRKKLQAAMKKARLYGGALLFVGADDGQPLDQPLQLERVKKGGLKFLHALTRYEVAWEQMNYDVTSDYYGYPLLWRRNVQFTQTAQMDEFNKRLKTSGLPLPQQSRFNELNIHPSRMVRLIGNETPDAINKGEMFGDSVLEAVFDAVKNAGYVPATIASLIGEMKFDIIRIPQLTQLLAGDKQQQQKMIDRFQMSNAAKSTVNALLLDKDEEWQRVEANFQGMPDIMKLYLLIAAGAADIPATRFLSQSPVGLNATGDSDTRNYFDKIKADQENELTPACITLDEVLIRSALGKRPDGIWYEWNSLWQMDDDQKSQIALRKAQTVQIDAGLGLIPFDALAKGRQNQVIEDGLYPGIETAIDEAEAEAERIPGSVTDPQGHLSGTNPITNPKLLPPPSNNNSPPNNNRRAVRDFNPNHDPSNGEFSSGGGGSTGFVSPNVGHLNFKQAKEAMGDQRHKALAHASNYIDKRLGISDGNNRPVLGAWADGAEHSLMAAMPKADLQTARVAMAMKGWLANQKSVLVFAPGDGPHFMARLKLSGSLDSIHRQLLNEGLAFHTLDPVEGGANVHIFGMDDSTLEAVGKTAVDNGTTAKIIRGTGEFIGTSKEDGTDAEQRADARRVYEQVIAEASNNPSTRLRGRDVGRIWDDVRNRWRRRIGDQLARLEVELELIGGGGAPRRPFDDYNPYHEPGGSPKGGQFASGPGGASSGSDGGSVSGTASYSAATPGMLAKWKEQLKPSGHDEYHDSIRKVLDAYDHESDGGLIESAKIKFGAREVDGQITAAALLKYNPAILTAWDMKIGAVDRKNADFMLGYMEEAVSQGHAGDALAIAVTTGKEDNFLEPALEAAGYKNLHSGPTVTHWQKVFTVPGGSEPKKEAPTESAVKHEPTLAEHELAIDPAVTDVGGDEWNKQTAKRLESEYKSVKPELNDVAALIAGETAPEVPQDDENYVPEEWASLSNSQQDDTQTQYIENNKESEYDYQVEQWHENGDALDDAKTQVADEFNDGSGTEWAQEAIDDWRNGYETTDDKHVTGYEEAGKKVPYTTAQLLDAISVDYKQGYEGKGDFTVTFDDSKLKEPEGWDSQTGTLPGIEPANPSEQLTKEMRNEITKELTDAFETKAGDVENDLEPPDYLAESANESLSEAWDQMDDEQKFKYAEKYGVFEKSAEAATASVDVVIPSKFDPLQEIGGSAYADTQNFARVMSTHRALDLINERGLKDLRDDTIPIALSNVRTDDNSLWQDWKGSSTSTGGTVLQQAIADELGGKINYKHFSEGFNSAEQIKKTADVEYARIGGYEGVKALVRAKWETTQYMLDKAGIKKLQLFRGIRIPHENEKQVDISGYAHLPDVHVARNGAASTSLDANVSNDWNGQNDRIVLRAEVPRTAAVSVPAYGQNVHHEREVIVAGTAWNAWDAWHKNAPSFDRVPMSQTHKSK